VSAPICRYLPRRSSRPGHAGDSEINLEKPSSDTVGERRDHAKNGTGLPHPAKPRYEGARTKGDTLPPSAAAPSMNNTLPSGEPAFLKGVVEEEQDNPQCETNQESTLPDEEEKLIKHIRHQFNTQQSVALHLHGVLAGRQQTCIDIDPCGDLRVVFISSSQGSWPAGNLCGKNI